MLVKMSSCVCFSNTEMELVSKIQRGVGEVEGEDAGVFTFKYTCSLVIILLNFEVVANEGAV